MIFAYSFFVGLFVTVVAIAILWRFAHLIGAIDEPGPRKVHSVPVPRIGGIGIATSVLLATIVWTPLQSGPVAFLIGAAIIVLTGIWDDIRPLNYKSKIISQSVGICALLSYGLPLGQLSILGLETVSPFVSYPIAFLFIFFVTNAFNLFDGLDGLAGGCLIVSIGAIALLAILSGDAMIATVGVAMIGGVIGFLRFNSYPAVVFMGDAGSQFLGFTAGYLALLLVTVVNPALNIGLPILVLGLPLLDTIAVATRRILQGRSPFQGDRQHLHHRLLAIGLGHAQTVTVLYAIQILMAATAYLFRYQDELFVLAIFVGYGVAIFGALYWIERAKIIDVIATNGRKQANASSFYLLRKMAPFARHGPLAIALLVGIFLVFGGYAGERATRDVAILSLGVCGALIIAVFLKYGLRNFFFRLSAYSASIIVCFLLIPRGPYTSIWDYWTVNTYLSCLAILVVASLAIHQRSGFRLSPQDLLMALLVVLVPNLDIDRYFNFSIAVLLLQVSILFYSIEYVLSEPTRGRTLVPLAAGLSLLIVGVTGLA